MASVNTHSYLCKMNEYKKQREGTVSRSHFILIILVLLRRIEVLNVP